MIPNLRSGLREKTKDQRPKVKRQGPKAKDKPEIWSSQYSSGSALNLRIIQYHKDVPGGSGTGEERSNEY